MALRKLFLALGMGLHFDTSWAIVITRMMNVDIENILESAALSVFPTMLDFSVSFEKLEGPFCDGEPLVAGAVGITGAFSGIIYVYASASFARRITCGMLRMTDAEIEGDPMVNDVLGELTNMIAGHIKRKLDVAGNKCLMTIPTIVRGTSFSVAAISGATRYRVCSRCDTGKVLIEALLKPA